MIRVRGLFGMVRVRGWGVHCVYECVCVCSGGFS